MRSSYAYNEDCIIILPAGNYKTRLTMDFNFLIRYDDEFIHLVNEVDFSLLKKELPNDFEIKECEIKEKFNKKVLMESFAKTFDFPEYFGNNWDALNDCLLDLDQWMPAKGYILILSIKPEFRDVKLLDKLILIWQEVGKSWSLKRVPFHLIIWPAHLASIVSATIKKSRLP